MIDLQLDVNWQLAPHANGDMLLVTGLDCLMQDIRLEALSQEGDLFYDAEYGWSLLDFMQSPVNDLTQLELEQRVLNKLARREEVDIKTVSVSADFGESNITIYISFRFIGSDEIQQLNLSVGRVSIEVIEID